VLGTDARVSEYQVRQTDTGADVFVVGTPDIDALSASLVTVLQRHGMPDPQIGVGIVDRIPRNAATGKLKRFVALPPPVG
jgi:hypothetical protein